MSPDARRSVRTAAMLVSILFFGAALIGMVGRSRADARPEPAGPRQEGPRVPFYLLSARPKVLGFYENEASTADGTGSSASLHLHAGDISMVSPFWFSVGAGGTLMADRAQPDEVAWAHAHGVLVAPLVVNVGSGMLTDASARSETATTLEDLVRTRGYDGVVVDFELLPPAARDGLTALITQLSAALQPQHKVVGVTVFPRLGRLGTLPDAYDYRALGRAADDVILMAYDHHYDGSAAGPVAPYPWVQENLFYLLRQMPRRHVVLGVGLYGYDWPDGGAGETVAMNAAVADAARRGITPRWRSGSGEFTYRYTDQDGTGHTVWYEGVRSVAEKAALARRYAIGAVALWRIGFETPKTWPALETALRSGRPT